jgi:hypothetical protein
MTDPMSELSDEALGRRLAAELPRHGAPARLRQAVAVAARPRSVVTPWLSAGVAAMATALALLLFFVPLLPRITPADPVQRLVRSAVAEHTRTLMWGARRPDLIPTALPWLTQESGIGLQRVFSGDERLTFVDAEPVYIEQRRGIALHYRDEDGHLLTYLVLPFPGLPMPDRQRVQVDRWRPALLHDSGFSVWVWKQGDLACLLISDMISETDLGQFRDYFVRVRVATEPVPAY